MYLKSIEIYGFKSFANKILFEFHNGVTGIVGPNGSGKSNVADAVRWVLGEQRTKQLRGASMQDVIFAGTELKKPMSYASVSITLDNADHALAVDYEEVKVSRRLYRSGESEYLINGTACRLRDVQELFYDTGIGKEGYSIIGQGQIERILSGKPEERRELFDEAAGIVKFKRRKATAQKKLEEERQNLSRVKDILKEIEKHLSPLEKQAEIAKLYLAKRDELKTYDVNLFLADIQKTAKTLESLSEKLQTANDALAQAKDSYEAVKAQYQEMQGHIGESDEKIEEITRLCNETTVRKEQLEGELRLVEEQINAAVSNDNRNSTRIGQLETRLADLRKEQQALEAEKQQYQLEDTELKEKQQHLLDEIHKVQQDAEDDNAACDRINGQILSLLHDDAAEAANQERYGTMTAHLKEQKQAAEDSIREAQEKIKSLTEAQEAQKQAYAEIAGQKEAARKEQQETEAHLDEIRSWMQKQNLSLVDRQNRYYREVSKLESLHNITEYYEGYGNSVRKIMEQKAQVPAIAGVVADVIQTEKKYETAIEIALGGNIQNIITEDEKTATDMIAFLKENHYGRATFLPLTTVRPKKFEYEDALAAEGVIGLASSLVQYEEKYSKIAEYLLGTIVVTDEIEHAKALAKAFRYRLKIVTLDGEFLAPGGSLTGGAFKHNNNFLGRKRELAEVSARVKKYKAQTEEIEAQIAEKKTERDAYRLQLAKNAELRQALSLQENTLNINLENLTGETAETKEQITSLELLLEKLAEEQQQVAAEQLRSQDKQLSFAEQKEALETKLAELRLKLEETQKSETALLSQLADIQTERQKKTQAMEFTDANIRRLSGDLALVQKEKQQIDEEMKRMDQSLADRKSHREELKETLEECKKQNEAYAEVLGRYKGQKQELAEAHTRLLDQREALSGEIASLDKEAFRLGSQIERAEENRSRFINYMWEEYELTYETAKTLYREGISDQELRRRVKELRNEIKALGTVNVNAIEEYKETLERYEFLTKQHDDIEKSENALQSVIKELDTGMRRQFQESFEQISKEFHKTFRELFEGGKGTLELIDETGDVLDASISITAQPPGKKLQNMMQLSGGEKALTAIALLFAIQNLKPSPFCLLDEIEAALDDSNITRFAKYLGKLTRHTQFIVITHRKGTMAAADRLYGITMQEKGVSALVSVNLIEEQLEA